MELTKRSPEVGEHSHPIYYAQLGVLGDLCLTRVNGEIQKYYDGTHENPFDRVFLCDVIPAPGTSTESQLRFLQQLYERTVGYNCFASYFHEHLFDLDDPFSPLDRGKFDETVMNAAQTGVVDDLLTPTGLFLFRNYQSTRDSVDRHAIFEDGPRSAQADWIFYLAIAPDAYELVLADLFEDSVRYSNINIIALLEKPFQNGTDNANLLADQISEWEEEQRNFKVFAVDHYAAKWTVSQIPGLLEAPDFREFLSNVEQISIELVEHKDTPEYRFGYMSKTGLFFDMMPHVLIPLQFLFGDASQVSIELPPRQQILASYEGYARKLEKWREAARNSGMDLSADHVLIDETYFCANFELTIGRDGQEPQKIDLWFRSGKAMRDERKRVLLKRRGRLSGTMQIDIARDRFEVSDGAGYTIPAKLSGDPNNKIRGYAKIIHDVMQYIARLRELPFRPGEDTATSPALMKVREAAKIISEIHQIYESFGDQPDLQANSYERQAFTYIDEGIERQPFSTLI